MSRRKGEITSRMIDREYPFQVEIVVPTGGLDVKGFNWRAELIAGKDYGRRGGGERAIQAARWCFRTPEQADEFAARSLGLGRRVDVGKRA